MFPHGLELNLSKKVSFRKATISDHSLENSQPRGDIILRMKYLGLSFLVIFANVFETKTTNRYLSCLMLLEKVS